jgi:ABC-2 type transport system permease protein
MIASSLQERPVPAVPASERPSRGLASDLRVVSVVWRRELIRFSKDRPRLVAALVQPLLYMFVLGTGLSSMVPSGRGGADFRVFLFPGVLALTVLFTCMFSAGSLVWDREFGFMREMMVAPVRRWAVVLGKVLGGATAGTSQALVMLVFGYLAGVSYSPSLVFALFGIVALLALAVTGLGVALATFVPNMQSFMAVVQLVMLPAFFLSGALYPLERLPMWLVVATRLNPLTYAVDSLRHTVLGAATPALTWGHFVVPVTLDLAIVGALGLTALGVATARFSRVE